jgi:RNA polymerase sigma factor (sigma-70 family)
LSGSLRGEKPLSATAGPFEGSAVLPESWALDGELLSPFGQYRLMSGTGASESTATDAALISQSLVDPECFSLIVERHATSVFRYLASRVDRSSSEDLLSDVFEAAFRARQRYDSRYDDALPWLLGIATNVIRHHRRSDTRHASMVRRVTQLHGRTQEPSEGVDAVVASAELNDQMQQMRRALAALDDKDREILVLSAGLGLRYEDIARALGIRVGTVRSRLSRARRRLRELLATDGQYSTYVESKRQNPVGGEGSK